MYLTVGNSVGKKKQHQTIKTNITIFQKEIKINL
jgi:hypothetical protein